MTPEHPHLRTYRSQRLQLSFAEWGRDSAPLLVLVHGGRDHKRSWDWTARLLAADYHVVAPDLRGHGESDWASDADYSIQDFAYDLAVLMKQLDKDPAILVGHSLGGSVVLRYAGVYPERVAKLVAIEGLGLSPRMMAARAAMSVETRIAEWMEKRLAHEGKPVKRYATFDEALARMREANAHLSAEQTLHLTEHGVRRHEDGSVSFLYDPGVMNFAGADITMDDVRALWRRVSCPTLLLYGRDSAASNPLEDGRAAFFSNARVEYFENAGHWLHHDRHDAFMASLRAFLA